MKVTVSELINSKEIRTQERNNRFRKNIVSIVEEEKWRFLEGNITTKGFDEVILWHIIGDEIKITFNNGKIRYCKKGAFLIKRLEEL